MAFQFDPATLMTMAFVLLATAALVTLGLGRTADDNGSRYWWTATFLLGASGFGATMIAPHDAQALGRELANLTFLLAYGACYTGARLVAGRRVILPLAFLGAGLWALSAWVIELPSAPRMPLASILVAAYSIATAGEFLKGARRFEKGRRLAGWLIAGHGLFYLVRALVGPTFGMTRGWSESAISLWGAIFAAETIIFAVTFGALLLMIRGERAARQAQDLAFTDALTGIGNRRAFDAEMPKLLARDSGAGIPALFVLLDLDGFKLVNDRQGHPEGDKLLCSVAAAVETQLSDEDRFWRIGGDEFALYLPGRTRENAARVLRALERAVAGAGWRAGDGTEVTVSASQGLAECRANATLPALLEEADRDLYKAKRARFCAEETRTSSGALGEAAV